MDLPVEMLDKIYMKMPTNELLNVRTTNVENRAIVDRIIVKRHTGLFGPTNKSIQLKIKDLVLGEIFAKMKGPLPHLKDLKTLNNYGLLLLDHDHERRNIRYLSYRAIHQIESWFLPDQPVLPNKLTKIVKRVIQSMIKQRNRLTKVFPKLKETFYIAYCRSVKMLLIKYKFTYDTIRDEEVDEEVHEEVDEEIVKLKNDLTSDEFESYASQPSQDKNLMAFLQNQIGLPQNLRSMSVLKHLITDGFTNDPYDFHPNDNVVTVYKIKYYYDSIRKHMENPRLTDADRSVIKEYVRYNINPL